MFILDSIWFWFGFMFYFGLVFILVSVGSSVINIWVFLIGGKAKPLKTPKTEKKEYDEV